MKRYPDGSYHITWLDMVRRKPASSPAAPTGQDMTGTEEKAINEQLVAAFVAWCALDDKHPDDVADFKFHIHALQNMIAWRVARRADPGYWDSRLNAVDEGPCPSGQHHWVGRQMGGSPDMAESYEWIEYCDVCGMENTGD